MLFSSVCSFAISNETSLGYGCEDEQWFYYSNHSLSMVLVVKHSKEMA